MKKILLFLTLISFSITQSQIVNIPDANFKAFLTSNNAIDTNNDYEIQVSEAESYTGQLYYFFGYIDFYGENFCDCIDYGDNADTCGQNAISELDDFFNQHAIKDLTGIEAFINVSKIHLQGLYLTSQNDITISNFNNLNEISLSFFSAPSMVNPNIIPNINLSNNPNLTHISVRQEGYETEDLDCNGSFFEGNWNYDYTTFQNLEIENDLALTNLEFSGLTSEYLNTSTNINLKYLNCSSENLTSLDLSNNTNLMHLYCDNNNLTTLDLSDNLNLTKLFCSMNNLASLDLSNNINLELLACSNNNLTSLNLSNNINLTYFTVNNNENIYHLNLKNGNNSNLTTVGFSYLPALETVCVDDVNSDLVTTINNHVGHSIIFTEYCSLIPIQSNQINGNVIFDLDSNGCDSSDISIQNLMLVSNNGTDNFATFTQNNGNYLLYTNEGIFTTEVTTNLPSYFTVSPSSQTNTFAGFDNTFTADFCIQPNQTVNDVNISLIPTTQARPGFNTTYQIVYKNVGTTQLNGNINLTFDNTKLSFLNASETISSQTSNSVTFDYSNLNPFETRTIDLEFNVSAPPTTEIDDILNFTTIINPIVGDNTTNDNIFELNQTVIGSYDPNDITCLEGNQVLFANKDKYLHYIIRFQNTGTASAINVVVKNILDNHLDWSTLQLESLSHNNRIAIKNGNEIEFIFENINLIDSTTDEPNSHGFIAYKIKPKTDIALDDVILNKADIFFDYNSPIETNTASTTIVNVLAVNENTLLDFSVYPTPTENILNIKSKTEISKIEIYSKLGQLILKNETENNIDISNLTNGLYFVKAEDINGNFGVKKIIKK